MTKEDVREALTMTVLVHDGAWVPIRYTPILLDAMGLARFLSTCYTRVMVKRNSSFLFYAHEGELTW